MRAEAEGSGKDKEKAMREEKAMLGIKEEVGLVYDALDSKLDEMVRPLKL